MKEQYTPKQNEVIERLVRTKMCSEDVRHKWRARDVIDELRSRGHIGPEDDRTDAGLLKKIQRVRKDILSEMKAED